MEQGFDVWDNRGHMSISDTNTAIQAPTIFDNLGRHVSDLVTGDDPFCLFLHYFEPHSRWLWHPDLVDFEEGARGLERHTNHYDSEIAFVDDWVGRTLDMFETVGLDENTIIVLVSDHGEAFMEHGHYFHGQTLYDEVIRVPMIMRIPGVEPARVTTPTALIDLAPTLLGLIGAQIPEMFEGVALFDEGGPAVPEGRHIFSELLPYSNNREHLIALIAYPMKAIYDVGSRRFQLFDLDADPSEQESQHRDRERLQPLRDAVIGWLER